MPRKPRVLGRRIKWKEVRPSRSKRGYDRQWYAFRDRYLYEHPYCEDCETEGLPTTLAVELHHKKKVKTHPHLRLDEGNVMGLCKRHHGKRTARGE